MGRQHGRQPIDASPVPPKSPLPPGSLMFADPSMAAMPRQVHTFNEPHSQRSKGNVGGVLSGVVREGYQHVTWTPDGRPKKGEK